MKFIFAIFAACLMVVSSPVAAQQKKFSQKEMEAMLIIVSSDTVALSKNYRKTYGVSKSRADVMAKHYKNVMADPKTRKEMAKSIIKSVRVAKGKSPEQSRALVSSRVNGAMIKMSQDGLKRMTKRSQLGFYRAVYPIFTKSTTKNCAIMFGKPGQEANYVKAELETYNKISPKELANYFLFLRKSIEFSANNRGRPVKMSRKEQVQAQNVFLASLAPGLKTHRNSEGILRAMTGDPSASDKDFCDMGRMIMKAMITAPPEQGGTMARLFLLQE